MTVTIKQIELFFEGYAPASQAANWDNVGFLIGDHAATVQSLMTCLTLTIEVAQEAIEDGIDLIVTHHPFPFVAMKKITTKTIEGRLLLMLARHNIAVYSPHTAFDNAEFGINRLIADRLLLRNRSALQESPQTPLGCGRIGSLPQPQTFATFCATIKSKFRCEFLQVVGEESKQVKKVAIACGAGDSFIPDAINTGCDVMVTGEARLHELILARASGLAVVLLGHHVSERFAMEHLVEVLNREFPHLKVLASEKDVDPLRLYI